MVKLENYSYDGINGYTLKEELTIYLKILDALEGLLVDPEYKLKYGLCFEATYLTGELGYTYRVFQKYWLKWIAKQEFGYYSGFEEFNWIKVTFQDNMRSIYGWDKGDDESRLAWVREQKIEFTEKLNIVTKWLIEEEWRINNLNK